MACNPTNIFFHGISPPINHYNGIFQWSLDPSAFCCLGTSPMRLWHFGVVSHADLAHLAGQDKAKQCGRERLNPMLSPFLFYLVYNHNHNIYIYSSVIIISILPLLLLLIIIVIIYKLLYTHYILLLYIIYIRNIYSMNLIWYK